MSETPARQRDSTPAKYPSAIQVYSYGIWPVGIIAIVELVMGAVYLYDCPRQPYIPIYLLVKGVFSLLPSVVVRQTNTDNPGIYRGSAGGLISFFLLCWFIAGNVWIYSIYEPNYNKTTTSVDPYCDKALYLFAFWSTNLTYILILLVPAVIFACFCCGVTCLVCCDD
ncbi:hypothetical protein PAMA_013859 [Pampus argenteus]